MTVMDKAIVVFLLAVCGLSLLASPVQHQCVSIGSVINLMGDCGELRGVDY